MKLEKLLPLFFCYYIFFTVQAQNTKEYFIPYQREGKWGYADTLGNVRLKPLYEVTYLNPESYSDNRFIISEQKRYGVVDNQNKIIIPFEFDYIYMKYSEDYKIQLFVTEKNKKYGLYNTEGKQLLETKNEKIMVFDNDFSNKLSSYSEQLYFIIDIGSKSNVYSYAVSTGEFRELIPAVYSKERIYNPSFKEKYKSKYIFNYDKNYYTLSNAGFTKITAQEHEIIRNSGDDREFKGGWLDDHPFYKFEMKNNQIYKLSLKEEWDSYIKEYKIDTLKNVSLNIKFKQFFLLDLKTNFHNTPEDFENIKNVLILYNGKKYAVLSPSQTDQQINYSYTQLDTLSTKELLTDGFPLIKVYKNKKWGVINTNDSLEIPFKYDEIIFFSPSIKVFQNRSSKKSNYYGFIVKDRNNYFILNENQCYLYNYPFTDYRHFQKEEHNSNGFYIFNEDKKGIVYSLLKTIYLFKANYPKNYKLEIGETYDYNIPFALIKVYDENNKFLGYADEKGINYWGK